MSDTYRDCCADASKDGSDRHTSEYLAVYPNYRAPSLEDEITGKGQTHRTRPTTGSGSVDGLPTPGTAKS